MNPTFKLKNIFSVLLFLTIVLFETSCGSKSIEQSREDLFLAVDQLPIHYNFKQPESQYFLPYVLSEISGLSYRTNGNLLAVNDETGVLFEFSLEKKDIISAVDFYNPGDYEGVEEVGNKIYVLESDGDVYSFEWNSAEKVKTKKYESQLSRKNDAEGLGYDQETHSLLIACKAEGQVDGNNAKGRAIYAFNLEVKELSKDPIFTVSRKKLQTFWEKQKNHTYQESKMKFKPSAVAVNPVDGNYYLLSSVGKLLVVLNREGVIIGTYPLSRRVLTQPEGLCFAPNGDMYISSEGDGDRGYILKFSIRKQ